LQNTIRLRAFQNARLQKQRDVLMPAAVDAYRAGARGPLKPNFATALTRLGNALMHLLDLEQAIAAHVDAYRNRGMAQLLLNWKAAADRSFDRALSFNPKEAR
jgi:hypothetical protein